jgi:hypothetical protein
MRYIEALCGHWQSRTIPRFDIQDCRPIHAIYTVQHRHRLDADIDSICMAAMDDLALQPTGNYF